ncbi:putative nuclease HARBI1 [Rhinatrema bivittatum]|uniref:putative nuclease HARBI1 n=1 Tax=Rhinatrema bivittatum TaxID=194408 RepID=UPI00112909D1|nr:putative nuclease HARBI1 [Rhinatrema bivittatum]
MKRSIKDGLLATEEIALAVASRPREKGTAAAASGMIAAASRPQSWTGWHSGRKAGRQRLQATRRDVSGLWATWNGIKMLRRAFVNNTHTKHKKSLQRFISSAELSRAEHGGAGGLPEAGRELSGRLQARVLGGGDFAFRTNFPAERQGLMGLKRGFYVFANFPNVLGGNDCTHMAIIPPRDWEEMYRNRKLFHSINVQVVCDAQMFIFNMVARHPGAAHDSFILRQSGVREHFEDGLNGDGWLIGD